jgi:hypothetical protein
VFPVFNTKATTNIDVLNMCKFLTELEDIFGGFKEDLFVFEFEIGTDVLMKTDNIDMIFLCGLNGFIKVILTYTKFTLGATCDYFVMLACTFVRVDTDEDRFA